MIIAELFRLKGTLKYYLMKITHRGYYDFAVDFRTWKYTSISVFFSVSNSVNNLKFKKMEIKTLQSVLKVPGT